MLMRCSGVTLSETIEPLQVPVPSMKEGSVAQLKPMPPNRVGVLITTRPAGRAENAAMISSDSQWRPSVCPSPPNSRISRHR